MPDLSGIIGIQQSNTSSVEDSPSMAQVGIVLGSKSDAAYAEEVQRTLDSLGISYEIRVISAHRNPDGVREYALKARERGFQVLIGLAGHAAALPGVLASWTTLPVIGVPLPTSDLKGIDSLYSIVQMPGGVPVACMAIGMAGATNAALFAAEIIALKDEKAWAAVEEHRRRLRDG